MAVSKRRAGALRHAELIEQAITLRGQGHSYREIAARLSTPSVTIVTDDGVTVTPAVPVSHMWVKRAFDAAMADALDRTRDATDRIRNAELASLRAMEVALADKVTAGDTDAIRTRLAIMDRRSKYLGLDVPGEVAGGGSATVPAELLQQLDAARAANVEQERALVAAVAPADVVTAELVD